MKKQENKVNTIPTKSPESKTHNNNKNKTREYKVTLNDDEMAIIHLGLKQLVKLDNTSDDTGIDDYESKLATLIDVFMAW